jgi:hypothetical protein
MDMGDANANKSDITKDADGVEDLMIGTLKKYVDFA